MKYTIKQYRKQVLGLTLEEAGEMMGMTKQAFSQIEKSDRLSASTIFKIMDTWNVDLLFSVKDQQMYIITPDELPDVQEGSGGIEL